MNKILTKISQEASKTECVTGCYRPKLPEELKSKK
ncbi:cyclic lactone autoinducer peptide [Longirhabdus pacifica]